MKKHLYLLGFTIAFFGCKKEAIVLETDHFRIALQENGQIVSFRDTQSNTEFLPQGEPAPLLTIRADGEMLLPVGMEVRDDLYRVSFPGDIQMDVKIQEKSSHVVFEILQITGDQQPDLAIWGPYPTTISETIGECVGVVRNGEFAIGIQALNPKTLGGYPVSEDDIMPSYNIFEGEDYADIAEDKRDAELYRGNTAKAMEFGSVLQAYCRDRSEARIISNWGHDKFVAPAYHDGGIVGSKIALFGCPAGEALATIGRIELEEGLPHPIIDGVWGKESPGATASYLIIGFGEQNLDDAIALTKKAGLRYLYHGGPFETWGHFALNPQQFPDNWESMKRCVDRAAKEGVDLGVHTLSNFITTNDPYVTPVPDPRLAEVGTSILTKPIDEKQTSIPIESPDFFNQYKNNSLHTVRIGDELIRYASVTEKAPWILLDCVRGAFNTRAASHEKGEKIAKLMDHGYKVFLAGIDMQDEVARTIARLFNETGLRQISFDGLEGCWASGMGQYGRTLFANTWHESLNDDLKGKVINDASNPGHYFWHIYTRMNWGEPWYAGFRESQTQYRLKNQNFYRRNLMPHMLGWFSMKPETSIEDAEWLLARAAGFDAGFALVTSPSVVEANGYGEEILLAIKEWESARLGGAFSAGQKELMQSVSNEFHLEKTGDGAWGLTRVYSDKFTHQKKIRQPGEPVHSTFSFSNKGSKQALSFILTADGTKAEKITLELDNHKSVELPAVLLMGQHLKYTGGNSIAHYDAAWQRIGSIRVDENLLMLGPGDHTLVVDCQFGQGGEPGLKIELRTGGDTERISLNK